MNLMPPVFAHRRRPHRSNRQGIKRPMRPRCWP